jgi:sterol desaturase/sphingolipid hydroxylase (fatty acid hydroxylase superfamily)
VSAIAGFLSVLPEQMRDPVLFAIPFFLVLLILEWTAARKLERIEQEARPQSDRPGSGAYLTADSWASIRMGLISVATTAGWKFVALLGYAAIYAYLAPWHLPATRWYTWVIAIVGVDLLYYWYHRFAHRIRLIWATHQAHHSSQYFNFATAVRQKWNNSGRDPNVDSVAAIGYCAVDGVLELLDQSDLPVLGAHRTDRQNVGAVRIHLQHAVSSSRAPRHGC